MFICMNNISLNWSDFSIGRNMTFKVAHKVILGFATILLLLLFASMSSVNILIDIEASSTEVDEFAIPVQKHSNAAQIQLLKQAKISALITNADNISQLKKQFLVEGQTLTEHIKQLALLLVNDTNKNAIQAFKTSYRNYVNSVDLMFRQKRLIKQSNYELRQQQKELDLFLNEASAILVDLTYLEDYDKQSQIDRIAGAAGQIEGYMINLTDSTKEIMSLESLVEVTESQETIEMAITNVEHQLSFLVRLGEEYNTDGLIEQFVDEFGKSKEKLSGELSLFANKKAQLNNIKALNDALAQSEAQVNQSISEIDKLLVIVDANLSDLQRAVFDNVNQGRTTTFIILAVLSVIGFFTAYATVRAMVLPLRSINEVLSYLAKGDLSRQLEISADDEYGKLSKNVNLVVEDLRVLIEQISKNTHLLTSSAVQSSHEMEQVIELLEQQKNTVEQVNIITDELSNNADDVLVKTTEADSQMTKALIQSDELEQVANLTNNKMTSLVKKLDTTTELMENLQQESTNIGGILSTIQGIADQTNLLALNAAIEAARAGEVGRGFAVVADEVRLLASRTQESTAEIHTMINALQSQTTKAVSDIEEGKDEANLCQQHTNELLKTLVLIHQAIKTMSNMSSEIAESATAQNQLSNDIKHSIKDVVADCQESSQKSSSTLTYSQQVATLAQKLDKSVDEFTM